jgi:hypothetical protein
MSPWCTLKLEEEMTSGKVLREVGDPTEKIGRNWAREMPRETYFCGWKKKKRHS